MTVRRPPCAPLDVDALYARHRAALLTFFVRRTAETDVAVDLWAETFAQAVENRHRYRGATADEEAGWLYGIARRQLAGYYRRGSAERRALDRLRIERPPADPELFAEIERRAGLTELRREVAAALGTLSQDTRRAVQLRVVDELPYPDVARRLEISEPAARARVSRGLNALSQVLDAHTIQEATT